MGFGVPVCLQIMCSDLGVRSLARPVLAIPDALRHPLTEVRSNSRSSTPAAAYQTNMLGHHGCFGKVVGGYIEQTQILLSFPRSKLPSHCTLDLPATLTVP